jgi:penicillin-binding protein 1A
LVEHTSAFSVFPNDGIRVVPRYVVKVTDYDGNVLEQNTPAIEDVIGERTARVMTSMLREVVLHGTAVAASRLNFPLAGKTGTTNDFTDAWFIGFSPEITCGVWMGYDTKKSLGNKETGAMAALPIWMDFMKSAIAKTGSRVDFRPPPADEILARQVGGQGIPALSSSGLTTQQTTNGEPTDIVPRSPSQNNRGPSQEATRPNR